MSEDRPGRPAEVSNNLPKAVQHEPSSFAALLGQFLTTKNTSGNLLMTTAINADKHSKGPLAWTIIVYSYSEAKWCSNFFI